MKCQKCGEREAVIQIKQRHSDGREEKALLCSVCAGEMGLKLPEIPGLGGGTKEKPEGNPLEMIQNLFQAYFGFAGKNLMASQETECCENCRMTLAEFRKKGVFGCPKCYGSFAEALEPVFRKVQMSDRHKGRAPGVSDSNTASTIPQSASETVPEPEMPSTSTATVETETVAKKKTGTVVEKKTETAAEKKTELIKDKKTGTTTEKKKKSKAETSQPDNTSPPHPDGPALLKSESKPSLKESAKDAPKESAKKKLNGSQPTIAQPDEEELEALERHHLQILIKEQERMMKKAVAEENYAEAAKYRDELKSLRAKLEKGGAQ